mmetsp:Transcript_4283/g.12109  ORF Transcript_4283/g.12109 Transcript_4283/m.12109 type:complete len:212 (-) Transcript_4283:192-827(-)
MGQPAPSLKCSTNRGRSLSFPVRSRKPRMCSGGPSLCSSTIPHHRRIGHPAPSLKWSTNRRSGSPSFPVPSRKLTKGRMNRSQRLGRSARLHNPRSPTVALFRFRHPMPSSTRTKGRRIKHWRLMFPAGPRIRRALGAAPFTVRHPIPIRKRPHCRRTGIQRLERLARQHGRRGLVAGLCRVRHPVPSHKQTKLWCSARSHSQIFERGPRQ